jgi:hypothetical protein
MVKRFGFEVFENRGFCCSITQQSEFDHPVIQVSPFEINDLIEALKITRRALFAQMPDDLSPLQKKEWWAHQHEMSTQKTPTEL